MSLPFYFGRENLMNNIDEGDLTDDFAGENPVRGLKATFNLRDRFLDRLSTLTGTHTIMSEDENQCSMVITLSRSSTSPKGQLGLDKDLSLFLRTMQVSLRLIALHEKGSNHEKACHELREAILFYAYPAIKNSLRGLQQLFNQNNETCEDFISKTLGVEDNISDVDIILGDKLIKLYNAVRFCSGAMEELYEPIKIASAITTDVSSLPLRLKSLLGKAHFANTLYLLNFNLGFPYRVYGTFIRAARVSKTCRNITFRVQDTTQVTENSPFKSATATTVNKSAPLPLQSPPSFSQPDRNKTSQAACIHASLQSTFVPLAGKSWLDILQPYLSPADRGLPPVRLQPEIKFETGFLIGTVLRGSILPIHSKAWYIFGFVVAEKEEEERRIGGLYAALLKEAQHPEGIFRELLKAVQTNQLVELFDSKEYSHFRNYLPGLETFLKTPWDKRSTVWRLKQFVKSDQTAEPPACLQRDYGFQFCRQREEVGQLKAIYKDMLQRMKPRQLHDACRHGRLYETAISHGIFVNAQHARLMKNDYPSPYVGFDNDKGLDKYRGRFFKKG